MTRIRSKSYWFRRLYLHFLPILVWLGTVACVVALFHHRSRRFEVIGIARAEVHDIGTNTRARLVSVSVQLFQKVNKGDPVAVVNTVPDDERIEAEIAIIQAEMDLVEAQLTELRKNYVANVNNLESEWYAEMRAFTADVVAAKAHIVDTNSVLETDLATLKKMQQEIEIFKIENGANFGTDIALYNQSKTMEANRDMLQEQIKREEKVLADYQEEWIAAIDRREKYKKEYKPIAGTKDEEAERVIDLAKEALERQKNELEERQRDVVLTAPCDGFVSNIYARVGEVVITPDALILSISEEKPNTIIAYAGEELVGHFAAGKPIEVTKGSEPKQIGRSKVTDIGPRVEQMPARWWRNPTIPRWGRAIQVEIPLGMNLVPGERVGIRGL